MKYDYAKKLDAKEASDHVQVSNPYSMNPTRIFFSVTLPDWGVSELDRLPTTIGDIHEQMRTVLRFAEMNIERQTGGPFAAGVFERESGKVIAIGVNRVVPSNMSSAHAEIVALSISQQRLGSWDLGNDQLPAMQLVVNWRPCAMCYGAIFWSGIRSLVIAGSDDACERITGFDEGPIHPEWRSELQRRGIALQENICYEQAVEVFEKFRQSGAVVYNGRSGSR